MTIIEIEYEEVPPLNVNNPLYGSEPAEVVRVINEATDPATITMEQLDMFTWAVKRNQWFVATYWKQCDEKYDMLKNLDKCLTFLDLSRPASPPDAPTSPYHDSWSDLDDDSLAGA